MDCRGGREGSRSQGGILFFCRLLEINFDLGQRDILVETRCGMSPGLDCGWRAGCVCGR